jgi:hypothetical protein
VLGVVLLAWLPLSFYYRVGVVSPWPWGGNVMGSSQGSAFTSVGPTPLFWGWGIGRSVTNEETYWTDALWPVVDIDGTFYYVSCPLWLLAFLCLAWPVTSFILARRRHKRGFPVEPVAGGEAVSPPASSS